MLVHEVMTRNAVTVSPDTTVKEAVRRLAEHQITAMPVVDADGHLVGVVSEADVIRDTVLPDPRAHELPVHLTGGPYAARVSDVMSHFPLTVRSDSDLASATELLTGTAVKSLPVVDGGAVVGVISRRDIIAALARRDEMIEADVDELLRQTGLECVVDVEDGVVLLDGPDDEQGRDVARTLAGTVAGVVAVRFRD